MLIVRFCGIKAHMGFVLYSITIIPLIVMIIFWANSIIFIYFNYFPVLNYFIVCKLRLSSKCEFRRIIYYDVLAVVNKLDSFLWYITNRF